MTSIVLKIDGNEVNFEVDLTDNERDAIRFKIYELSEPGFFAIHILNNGNIDTNMSTEQLPRNVITIYPEHPSFNNKIVQFRFKLDTEPPEMTNELNGLFQHAITVSNVPSSSNAE